MQPANHSHIQLDELDQIGSVKPKYDWKYPNSFFEMNLVLMHFIHEMDLLDMVLYRKRKIKLSLSIYVN